jgi:hypothetical protein
MGLGSSILATSAFAAGGADIATAPHVQFGQLQVGDVANDPSDGKCWSSYSNRRTEFWSFDVTSGDKVSVEWDVQNGNTDLLVYDVGTTDFTWAEADPVVAHQPFSNSKTGGKSHFEFSAARSGVMPMAVCSFDYNAGPYSFTAYVKHDLVLSLQKKASVARRGTMKVNVLNPDGGRIDDASLTVALRVRSAGKSRFVGHGSVANGVANIRYRLPKALRGRRVSVSARATGASYLTTTSSSFSSKVR